MYIKTLRTPGITHLPPSNTDLSEKLRKAKYNTGRYSLLLINPPNEAFLIYNHKPIREALQGIRKHTVFTVTLGQTGSTELEFLKPKNLV